MANYYSNPTANAAIGTVDAEIRRMQKLAKHLQKIRKYRPLNEVEKDLAYRRFTGIHRRFLKVALYEEMKDPPHQAEGPFLTPGGKIFHLGVAPNRKREVMPSTNKCLEISASKTSTRREMIKAAHRPANHRSPV